MFEQSNIAVSLIKLIGSLLDGYVLLIIIRALLSWFSPNPYNKRVQLLFRATEPVLSPIRRIVPLQGIDISPIIAILLIDMVVKRLIIGLLSSLLLP
jgi:YggT family protein